ncbi:MAG: SOS response-associated peptidase [Phycisphaerales bacterium]
MCGRFTHRYTWKQLHRLLGLMTPEVTLPARYNVAPTQQTPVVVFDESMGGPSLRGMRWGLIPSWAKDDAIGASLVNARAEGVETKPSFRAAFKRRRCVVPISGFYEWKVVAQSEGRAAKPVKQPMYITPADPSDEPWLLAGLWESWSPADATAPSPVETFTIITTEPNEMMATLHNRMPVILAPDAAKAWLAPGSGKGHEVTPEEAARLFGLLVACPAESMVAVPVSKLVNSPKNDTVECTKPQETQRFGTLFDG